MVTLGERMRQVRGEAAQILVARRLGVHKNTLANYERNERSPDAETLARFVEIFPDVSPAWLLTGKGRPGAEPEAPSGEFVLPPLEEFDAPGLPGGQVASEQVVDCMAFRRDWLGGALNVQPQHLALITVKGDSMSPTLVEGDLVLIDTYAGRVEGNALYVIQLDDALVVKRIQKKIDGSILVKSDNPVYEAEHLSSGEGEPLEIVGRVVWMGKKV